MGSPVFKPPADAYMTIADLQVGEHAEVVRYHDGGTYTANLLRLGLIPGTRFQLVRKAPLGDPAEIRFRGFALAIRPSEATALEITRT